MTLDEAIKNAEEVAEGYKKKLKVYESIDEDRPLFTEEETECRLCAEEHRQLAEWLKDYKRLKEQGPNTWSLDDAREDFIYDVYNTLDFLPTNNEANRIIDIFDRVTSGIRQEPKTGHWEWVQYDYNPKLGNWHCSECRCVVIECVDKEEKGGIPLYKYCPQCGAKMEESEDEK